MQNGSFNNPDITALVENLIIHSKKGGNSAFLNLIKLFIENIYKSSFKLTLTKDSAQKLAIAAALNMWRNIKNYNEEIPFKRWVIYYVISTYINNKQNFVKPGSKGIELDKFSPHEKEFLTFPVNERVILCLYLEMNYTEKEIVELFPNMISEDIDEIVRRCIPRIASKIEDENIKMLSPQNWDQIISLRKLEDNDEKLNLFLELRNLITGYELLKTILHDSFSSVIPPGDLLHMIKGNMIDRLNDDAKKNEMENKKEEKKRKRIKQPKDIERTVTLRHKPKLRKTKTKNVKTKKHFHFNRIYIIAAVTLTALAAGGYFFFSKISSCEIKNVIGMYQVNGMQSSKTSITDGDVILTNNSSELELDIPNHGTIKLNQNSSLQIISNKADKLHIRIIKGEIKFVFINPSPRFNVNDDLKITLTTDDAVIKTSHSGFTIKMFHSSPFKLDVSTGYVKITDRTNSEFHLGAGYSFTQNKTGFIIPFNKAAKEEIKNILISAGNTIDAGQVKTIINYATENDLLTLWHLIPKAGSLERGSIIEKINEFTFLPYEEIERKAAQLDPESLIYVLNLLMVNYL